MMIAAIVLPALICALIAIGLRTRMRAVSWITWMGYMLIGTGVPVLAGQGAALLVINAGNTADAPLLLAIGLAGGLGWAAGAISMRITAPRSDS